jgi:hypothetical protein
MKKTELKKVKEMLAMIRKEKRKKSSIYWNKNKVECLECGRIFHTIKTYDVRCKCGSYDIDLAY